MKTLILALGNPILSDDGIAYEVADRLEELFKSSRTKASAQYDIIKSSGATMDIIPKLAGYKRLIVIDAVQLGSAPPGTVHRFSLDELAETVRPTSPHDINFATAFSMGKKWGYDIPDDIRIYGIEVIELLKLAENCTPQVTEKLDEIVQIIYSEIDN